ncbi:transposase domain-containing protein [Lachnospiraceae bacterium OttesenSCG-928-D06]|nr:transposase domain-containing protein [Lachnospiraceae bacterium OttesenSCG-928-D06]
MYTLVESARTNDLNVYEYLNHLLKEIPNTDFYNSPELVNQYLPWSKELPECCRLMQKRQRCLKYISDSLVYMLLGS